MKTIAVKFIVTGRVQRVFYRRFAQNAAAALHITGWVRNLADGSVEVYAVGTISQLADYQTQLQKGPIGSRVDKVVVEAAFYEWLDDFQIRQ